MRQEETDDPNVLGTSGDYRSGETTDLEVVIRQPHGTDPAPESVPRGPSQNPSKVAVKLETLGVKAFGDMGPNARTWIIRDRLIAGHPNSALQRHLDSVPPETPIRYIVDKCRVWESHADTEDRGVKPIPERAQPVSESMLGPTEQVVAAVTGPLVGLADLETMLKCLLPAVPAQAPLPRSVPTDLEMMLTCLLPAVPIEIHGAQSDVGNREG